MKRAALDPGVQEFAEIVRDANQLQDRIADFLRTHDGKPDTDTLLKLDIATRSVGLDSNVPELLRHLWGIHYVMESACMGLNGPLVPSVFPDCGA